MPAPEKRGHELREPILADFPEPSGGLEAIEHGQGTASEPSADFENDPARAAQPRGDGDRAHVIADRVETIGVREVVDPEPEPSGREEHLLARRLAAEERGVVLRHGLGERVGRQARGIVALLLLAHLRRVGLRPGAA